MKKLISGAAVHFAFFTSRGKENGRLRTTICFRSVARLELVIRLAGATPERWATVVVPSRGGCVRVTRRGSGLLGGAVGLCAQVRLAGRVVRYLAREHDVAEARLRNAIRKW